MCSSKKCPNRQHPTPHPLVGLVCGAVNGAGVENIFIPYLWDAEIDLRDFSDINIFILMEM